MLLAREETLLSSVTVLRLVKISLRDTVWMIFAVENPKQRRGLRVSRLKGELQTAS